MSRLTSILNSATLIGIEQPETLRAPEIEKGVGCDFDSYLLVPDNTLDQRIAAAKAKLGKDVVILGHHYQRDEVVKFADFRGDSLKLSQQAAEADAKYVVFCGVHFMAESADILRRGNQVVVLPDLSAGCSMADMADIGQVEACWSELASVTDTKKNHSGHLYEFDGSDQIVHRRKWRLGLHKFQRRRGDEVGVCARRKGAVSAGRASWAQHRLPHGNSAGRNDCLGPVRRAGR